jgi:hypothetical protein
VVDARSVGGVEVDTMPDISPLGARLIPTTPELSEHLRNEFPHEEPTSILARLRRSDGPQSSPRRTGGNLRGLLGRLRARPTPVRAAGWAIPQ